MLVRWVLPNTRLFFLSQMLWSVVSVVCYSTLQVFQKYLLLLLMFLLPLASIQNIVSIV